jgi:chitinase
MDTIAEQKLRRFRFLKYLYERTGGSEAESVPHEDIAQNIGLSQDGYRNVWLYLAHEGLVDGTRGSARLTHAGVVEIEAALSNPDQPTVHFPVNIIHIEQMSHSQIQQGTAGSTQSGTFTSLDLGAVAEFVRELKAQLSQLGLAGDDEAVAQSDITTIESQLSSPRPKVEIIKESLRSIRNIAEGAVGSMVASGIIAGIAKLLGP